MALSWKNRRRLSVFVLIVALPAYIVAAVSLVALFDRPPFWVELLIYVALGVIWTFPLKAVFKGVGQPDPDSRDGPDER